MDSIVQYSIYAVHVDILLILLYLYYIHNVVGGGGGRMWKENEDANLCEVFTAWRG
jgi:hypothetical protein